VGRGRAPAHAHALALAARELGGVAAAILSGVQAHQREQLVGTGPLTLLVPADESRDHRHIPPHGEVREEADLLDHVPDPPAQGGDVLGHDVRPVQEDFAGRRLDQAVDHLEAGRLAATGRSHQNADGSGRDLEREVVDGPARAFRVRVPLGDAAKLERGGAGAARHGRRHRAPSGTTWADFSIMGAG
jgi:hypothetical protein